MHGSPTSDRLTHLTIAPRFASSILHGEGGGERGIKRDEIQTETQAISYLLRSSIEDVRTYASECKALLFQQVC
jgi:hypothetical protein